MREVQIPGGTAQLRDRREEIKVRQQRVLDLAWDPAVPVINKVVKARSEWEGDSDKFRLTSLTRQESVLLMDWQDAMIVAVLASWTLPDPLPDVDTVQDLDQDLYNALLEPTREIQLQGDVFRRPSMAASVEEESPTERSSDSAGDAKGAPASGSRKATRKSTTGSSSTATGSSTAD